MDDAHHEPPAATTAAIRRALAVMTAWCDDEESTAFMAEVVRDLVEDPAASKTRNLQSLNVGLASLSGMLLLHLADATGVPPVEILRSYAAFWAALEDGPPPPD